MTETTSCRTLLSGYESLNNNRCTAVNFKLMATEYLADVLSYILDDKHLP